MPVRHRERHRAEHTGWLRAAVFGANDGILSTASLVLGVAAANGTRSNVLVAIRDEVVSELERFWSAMGNGGQRLFVLPGLDLTVATTAGNYDRSDQWVPPTRVIREVVLPSIL